MVTLTIYCPRCQSDRAYRHGKTNADHAHCHCPTERTIIRCCSKIEHQFTL
ncbi:IS1 family transposase [Aeromonas popoffii]|uniref:IS1 family transposase n=1 Tax=Aeromonas popoffii TaxID=70856 RepID=UPI000AD65283